MIRIVLGNIGSGKTAMVVREMALSDNSFFSNIITKKIKCNTEIHRDMIIEDTLINVKKDGTPIYKKNLNTNFWRKLIRKNDSLNVIIDEAHAMFNARRGMSDINKVMLDFLALLRRVLGGSDGYGELVLITQLDRRLDVVAKEMATKVQYCRCHYVKKCICGFNKNETNETPDKIKKCPTCGKRLKKIKHIIEVFNFINIKAYEMWNLYGTHSYYDLYYITDIEKYFPLYNTLQWDNLITED
jgi:hypothetical protein